MSHRCLRAAIRLILAVSVTSLGLPMFTSGVAADTAPPPVPLTAAQVSHRLSREVFGYLPYWELNDGTDAYLRYDLLSTIAFFGIGANADGSIDTTQQGYRAYVSDRATAVIDHAHAMGVRTVITFESFGTAKNAAFFTNATAQATFVQQAVALMQARGADGMNVDVELISGTYFTAYGSFLGALRQAALAANPNAQLSVATNASTSGARMAAIAVANGVDRAFLMGYGYRSSGSNPVGSIDPLVRANGGLSLSTSLDLYASSGVPLDHVLLGLPLYGLTWPTVTADLRSARQTDTSVYGGAKVFLPSSLPASAAGATFDYDPVEQSGRLVVFDTTRNTWLQTYYDDPTTIATKLSLTWTRNLAGAGFWALGYDRGQPGYWDAVANALAASKLNAAIVSPGATRTLDVTVSPIWQDGGAPATDIHLSNDGVTWSPWLPIAPSVPWHLADNQPDGMRIVSAQIRNATGAVSQTVTGAVMVDATAPAELRPVVGAIVGSTAAAAGDVAALVRWGATDAGSGVATYTLESSLDGAPYAPVMLPSAAATNLVVQLTPGHRYRWRVTATDAAGNVAAPVEGDPIQVGLYQDSSRAFRYSTGWRRTASGSASGGTVAYSSITGASTTFAFTGRSVSLLAPIGPSRGAAKLLVDGVAVATVNLYAPVAKARRVVLTRSWAVSGRHTVTLRVTGSRAHPRIDVDAFILLR
jgi:spore germination protein YaaH